MSKSMSRRSFLGLVGGSAAVLGLGLVGCGSSKGGAASTGGAGKTYVIATDTTFAPFEFTDDSNSFVGIDVDILAGAMEVAGLKYDLRSLGFDAAVAAMESGQADGVIAGMSITDARKEKYDFSEPYFDSYVAAAAKDGGSVSDLAGLKGQKVACKTGTQSADWAESIKGQYGFEITYFDSSDMMYQDVTTGNSAACFEDGPVMAYGVSKGNGLKLIATEKDKFSNQYGFAVMKGKNADLLEGFNKGLKELRDNGKYDEILKKYGAQ